MSNIRRGLFFSVLGKYLLRVLGLISTVLIARMLSPAEIGTFAIASSLVMILTEVKILGASAYLIRSQNISETMIRRAYGMAILMCWGIAILLISGSGMLSQFFKHDELQGVFIILAISFLFAPYISIPDAILSRTFRFKEISIIEMSASVFQMIVTLLLIYLGQSFFSLAWGQLSGMVWRFVLSLYFTRDTRIYFPSFSNLAEIAKLGVIISAANIVRRIHYSASDIVIGRLGSPTEVGIFSRGMGFIDFVSQIVLDGVNGVAQPYMSDLKRRGEDIVAAYIKSTALLLSLVWPILAVAGLAALSAIRLLFGDQWDQSAPIASVLAFWMMIKVVSFFSPQLLIAVDHENVMFRRDIASFTILAICLIFAYPYGLQAMGGAFLVSGLIEMAITLWLLRRYLKLSIRTLVTALTRPLIVTVVCYVVALCLDLVYPFAHATPLVVLALLALVVTPTWLLACKFLNLTIYFEVVRLLQPLLRRFAK